LLAPGPLLDSFSVLPPGELPADYRELLAHHDHMTARLERYHGRPVVLRVLARRQDADSYRRMILLNPRGSDQIVEFGLVWIDLHAVSQDVRAEILAEARPLGDILLAHNVLRRIEPKWYVRFGPGGLVARHVGAAEGEAVYGRIGVIHYEHQPAMRLLEVVRV